jgi:UDP-N-acetylglucosamine--N-acetylmuramyl-(pentapeptide) pyrophosphoryl-undecaprenol N-acetylglucosamine transferase
MTLSEVLNAGVPPIMVPYPYAAADHQTRNAQAVVEAGAGRFISDAVLSGPMILDVMAELCEALPRYQQATQALSRPHATEDVAQVLLSALS